MTDVFNDFNDKKNEINIYFDFLIKVDQDAPTLHYRETTGSSTINQTSSIDTDLQKILKSNAFLLLYNLVESSFKSAIENILSHIESQSLKYQDLEPKIQEIWIKQSSSNLSGANSDSIYVALHSVAKNIVDNSSIKFNKKKMNKDLSGSIDYKKIRETAKKYGITLNIADSNQTDKLLIIKTNRNDLAHGSITFGDCGKKYSIPDLIKIKNDTFDVIDDVLRSIKAYIDNEDFIIEVV